MNNQERERNFTAAGDASDDPDTPIDTRRFAAPMDSSTRYWNG
jgi:hypothetical protein